MTNELSPVMPPAEYSLEFTTFFSEFRTGNANSYGEINEL